MKVALLRKQNKKIEEVQEKWHSIKFGEKFELPVLYIFN